MIKFLKFVPIQLTLFLICGIVLGNILNIHAIVVVITVFLFLFGGLFILHQKSNFYSKYTHLGFQFGVFGCFILIGIVNVYVHTQLNTENHYSNDSQFSENSSNSVILKIRKELKSTKTFDKYEAELLQLNANSLNGRVLVNIKKDSVGKKLVVDDEIALKVKFSPIIKSLNPFAFDYQNYLKNQQVYHQLFTSNGSLLKLQNNNKTIFGITAKIRSDINIGLLQNGFNKDELAVVNALLLGQRQFISEDLLQSYIDAGAIHILAVSGLHIGIILLFLNFLFKPLNVVKNGKLIAVFLVISCLWFYAIIAGLSASVIRAVAMFTALSVGMYLNKQSSIYNTLFISMFFLLLFKPSFLVDVGFQLSYLAVFSIVWIQPKLYNLFTVKWWFFDKVWQLLTVSVAAQIGVLPLSLYYFHQFPGLFFVANMAIIPFLGIILIAGIVVMILALTQVLNPFIAEIYGYLIYGMNYIITWTSSFKFLVFKDISMSILLMIAIYLAMVLLVKFYEKLNLKRLIIFGFSILFLQSVIIFEKFKRQTANEFIVFNDYKSSVISLRVGDSISSTTIENNNAIKNYCIGTSIDNKNVVSTNEKMFSFRNETIFIVDSLGIYNVKSIKPGIIIVQNSPKINMDRLIKTLQPKMVVLAASNKKYYTEIWEQSCVKNKTPFYNVMQKGAFILKE